MITLRLLTSFVLLLLIAPLAVAQPSSPAASLPNGLDVWGSFGWRGEVGQLVRYQLEGGTTTLELTQQPGATVDERRLELSILEGKVLRGAFRSDRGPGGETRRLAARVPPLGWIELPVTALDPSRTREGSAQRLGSTILALPIGMRRCEHWLREDARLWLSNDPDLPVSLMRLRSRGGTWRLVAIERADDRAGQPR